MADVIVQAAAVVGLYYACGIGCAGIVILLTLGWVIWLDKSQRRHG